MVKILILLLSLLFAGDVGAVIIKHPAGGSCSTPTTGNLFNEGFEGTGYDSGKTVAESGTVAEDTSRPGTQSPTGLCSESLLVDTTSGTHYARIDEGTGRDEVYVRFYFYVASGHDTSKQMTILSGTQDADVYSRGFDVQFVSWGGPYIIGTGTNDSSSIAVSVDTCNYVDVHFVRNASSTISVNGGGAQTFTARNYPVRYYHAGKVINGDALASSLYLDIISASTSSM